MTTKVMASTSGTDSATTMPVRQPSERKLTTSTMPSASTKERTNSKIAWSTTFGWSAICSMSMPCGTPRHELVGRRPDVLAEREDVRALRHDDADAEGRLAALAHEVVGRVLEAARHRRDVAEAEDRARPPRPAFRRPPSRRRARR